MPLASKLKGLCDKFRKIQHPKKIYTEDTCNVKSYTFVFVCQSGELEMQSLLLAASMKRFLQCEHKIIAAVPKPVQYMGQISNQTRDILEKMDIQTIDIENTIVNENRKSKLHYMSNKIFAFQIPAKTDKFVFVDTDSMFCSPFCGDDRFSIPLNVRIVGMRGALNSLGKWEMLYSASGVRMPNIRIKVTETYTAQSDEVYIPPYFNSGFIAIHSIFANQLSHCWLGIYKNIIDSNIAVDNECNYFAEQTSLSIAIQKLNIPYEIMSEPEIDSLVFHYYVASNIKKWGKKSLALSLIKEFPQIGKILRQNKNWAFLF